MPRRKRNPFTCPICGTRAEPKKTWQLVSPFPDSKGRITVTIMGSFECPKCGHKWRGVVSKLKVGGASETTSSGSGGEPAREEGPVFEIDIDEE
ncbi:MAG: chromatin protein Cren7 [Crenarchaeota archaeon]|nr:chromatin protein Cren7 [Thermoproteota archaeon]